jgi:hypothetical protein
VNGPGGLPLDARAAIALMVVSAFCYSASVVVARDLHDAIAPMVSAGQGATWSEERGPTVLAFLARLVEQIS